MVLNLTQEKTAQDERTNKIREPDIRTRLISTADFVAANYTQTGIGQRHFPEAKRTNPRLTAYGCSLAIQKKLAGWIQIVNITETEW